MAIRTITAPRTTSIDLTRPAGARVPETIVPETCPPTAVGSPVAMFRRTSLHALSVGNDEYGTVWLGSLLLRKRFLISRAAQNIHQRVVPFVARVLEDALVGLRHRYGRAPRTRERGRVVHGELVQQRVLVDASETLDEMELVVSPAKTGPAVEVRRVDDERVALPLAARIAQPRPHAGRDVRTAVQRNDPRVVNHLVGDDDVARHLKDLDEIVVRTGHHRRTGIEGQTPLGK